MSSQAILTATPGQTVGPFYGYALPYPGDNELVPPGHRDAINLHGTVYDGAGQPVPDALVEIWQADEDGAVPREAGSLNRDGWTFTGFGRAAVDPEGRYSFTTVRPGPTQDGAPAFFAMTVFARGLLNRLFTRVYLPDDEAALASDPLLQSVPEDRRATLVARADRHGYTFDIRLQGDGETVFLSFPGVLMADLFWPGDERAGNIFAPEAVVGSMVEVEQAWLDALVASGEAPSAAKADLAGLVVAADVVRLASAAEASGAPVVPLLEALRQRLDDESGEWLHRGLTTQDVVDTALVLQARRAALLLGDHLRRQSAALARLAETHRDDPMVGRTLTQHARPITFGVKAANWLQGVLDAQEDLRSLRFPPQLGGPVGLVLPAAAQAAAALRLEPATPWQTVRTPFTRYADALVRCSDAFGHVAGDVLVLARTEVGEVEEPRAGGRGGSSSMPHKRNPVLSVLVRRAALTAPGLSAQLHLAAAESRDERPEGAWHTEWSTLALLSRRVLVAASQTTELLEGLRVHTDVMASRVSEAPDLVATAATVDAVLARLKESE